MTKTYCGKAEDYVVPNVLSPKDLGPAVRNFISLTLPLSPEFVNYILTSEANTILILLENIIFSILFTEM